MKTKVHGVKRLRRNEDNEKDDRYQTYCGMDKTDEDDLKVSFDISDVTCKRCMKVINKQIGWNNIDRLLKSYLKPDFDKNFSDDEEFIDALLSEYAGIRDDIDESDLEKKQNWFIKNRNILKLLTKSENRDIAVAARRKLYSSKMVLDDGEKFEDEINELLEYEGLPEIVRLLVKEISGLRRDYELLKQELYWIGILLKQLYEDIELMEEIDEYDILPEAIENLEKFLETKDEDDNIMYG